MKLQQWRDTGEYFEHEGHRIFYRVEGEGEPLLLIHGYPTSSWDWIKIWPELVARYRCITLDMLGFGYSDKPQQPYSLYFQADLYCRLLERLGVGECHVLAHDYGDTVAQELLARQNEGSLGFHMKTLNLLNGGLFPETHHAVFMQKVLRSPIGGLLVKLMKRGTLSKNLKKVFGPDTPPSEQEIDEFWELIQYNDGHKVMHRLIHYITERRANRERWVGALQQAEIPIRLTDGVLDPVSGGHLVDRYEALIPNPDTVRLEGVGHYPQVEAPEAVLASVLEKIEHSGA
ncbi:alpha/beta hydrolase [Halioglobus maricola]|uniref:Alpha/beta hydrolase n=1 Tax=Halioglobus maricola TaxID=2601894 RepID=A0A5P9NQ45_9GAMM|nr:alpha/beta hydrolase [Halioglobus maricola]QFU77575.1 alpha/beta hydrolase [Halioglobus maricola]